MFSHGHLERVVVQRGIVDDGGIALHSWPHVFIIAAGEHARQAILLVTPAHCVTEAEQTDRAEGKCRQY